ncbi:hypothetical protein [Paenibacillus sp. UNC451MF]|nr:hypothetical protein [Paenibacillus sp. UNC451MF]
MGGVWVSVDEVAERMHNDRLQFINIDCAAIKFYLIHRVNTIPIVETF